MVNQGNLSSLANIMRRDCLKMTTLAGSGHPTSCMSAAEIVSTLFFSEMKYDTNNANNPDNDEFILSKGHAAPILYSALFHAGCIKQDLTSLRKINSLLEGHPKPSPKMPWIKVATGSLGQGLSIGVGMALAAKLQKRKFRTYVLLGDSEIAEGSVYEAMELASFYKLNNLIAIVDANRLGQRGQTMIGHNLEDYKNRFKSFGWKTYIINGHNIKQIIKSLKRARLSRKPVAIIAKTLKGKGVSFLENKNGWHGKTLDKENLEKALEKIPKTKNPNINIQKPKKVKAKKVKAKKSTPPKYELTEKVAPRLGYGQALASLAESNSNILAVDSEVSNSTFSAEVKKKTPKQFIEAYIAEQNMIGMAQGLSIKGYNVFASTFAAFLSRAHDQIRMAGISSANITICGSHAGISIGNDGPSQMALEDLAMMRALPENYIFYPSDAITASKLTILASSLKGIKYIRTTREKLAMIYKNNDSFKVGDFKVLKKSNKDQAVLIGAGITTHENLKAYNKLKKDKINVAVVDLFCIRPFDYKKFTRFIKDHGKKIIVTEDHYGAGGIFEMLSEKLPFHHIKTKHLAIQKLPRSGEPDELLNRFKISNNAIVNAVKSKW